MTGASLAAGLPPGYGDDAFEVLDRAFERIETDPSDIVAASQAKAIGRMVLHAHTHSRYYRERLAPAIEQGRFVPERWRDIPVLTRKEVQDHHLDMATDVVPDGAGSILHDRTSGSTGRPIEFTLTTRTWFVTAMLGERQARWFGLDPTAPAARIARVAPELPTFPELPVQHGWSYRARQAPLYGYSIERPPAEQLDWLAKVGAVYVTTLPTNARELARTALRRGGPRPPIKAFRTAGEVVTADAREACLEAFGAPLIDFYACDELGKIAMECPVSGRYHVCTPNVLVELLDEHDTPVPPGQAGRVVVTSLYNHATPFIRYALGDEAIWSEQPCTCGRTLPLIERILGRTRNMLRLPDGNRRWLTESVIYQFRPAVRFRQYQVVQVARDLIEFRYVPEQPGETADEPRLQGLAASLIHPDMRIRAIAMQEIPRSPGGKYHDVLCLVE